MDKRDIMFSIRATLYRSSSFFACDFLAFGSPWNLFEIKVKTKAKAKANAKEEREGRSLHSTQSSESNELQFRHIADNAHTYSLVYRGRMSIDI